LKEKKFKKGKVHYSLLKKRGSGGGRDSKGGPQRRGGP